MKKYKIILSGFLLLFSSLIHAQVMYNKGDMYVGSTDNNKPGLYIKGTFVAEGNSNINHPGITVLTGDFINNVTNGYVFKEDGRSGTFEFRNETTQQKIGGKSENKASHPIKFPDNVIINNNSKDSTVTLAAGMSAHMKNIRFKKGRLVLDSDTIPNVANETQVAHLWLEDNSNIDYYDTKSKIQVNLDLGISEGHLIGFTPPFETLYSDYFFFNFLSIPSETELFTGGSNELWNTNPLRPLKGGTGYILGQGLVPYSNVNYYNTSLHDDWKRALFSEAIKRKYEFGRTKMPSSLSQYVSKNSISDSISGEKLINKNVDVKLVNGYNYLGNPFMVPLDLSALLSNNRDAWNIFNSNIHQNFWILTKGSKGYGEVTGTGTDMSTTFTFTASYLVGQEVGGTFNEYLIAPMQMFVLYNSGAELGAQIPRSARTHGNTRLLRSTFTEEPIDELLIQTTDKMSGGFDRLCVVFRNNATENATDKYDTEKLFNRTGGVNQIYTRSTDKKLLTTNVIKPDVEQLTMYFEPSIHRQEVELTAHRINSLQSIGQVILEDRKTNKKIDLTQTGSYNFMSSPADDIDRFVLHFKATPVNIEEEFKASAVNAYYAERTIYIQGLQETDLGSDVSVYNMQGQILHKERITEIAPCRINKSLNAGIYIIKVEGNNHVLKLPVK